MALDEVIARHGSVLVPDFAEVYSMSLVDAARTRDPVEVMLLIDGLPPTSRYAGRLAGESSGTGWGVSDFLVLDIRNAIESLRANVAKASGAKGRPTRFRPWDIYPGQEAARRKEQRQKFDQWFAASAAPPKE